MLPIIHGIIARRILLNFRADPAVVQRLLPEPLTVQDHAGHAIVGVCLIRFEHLRPVGMPEAFGISTENMAHRVAVLYPTATGMKPGVYIWRRETNSKFIACVGGTIFPGVHGYASFDVVEHADALAMSVTTPAADADVTFTASAAEWSASTAFATLEEASAFFCQGSCGYSTTRDGQSLEGLELCTERWQVEPIRTELTRAAFFEDEGRFPKGSVQFDCALLMRNLYHSWRQLKPLRRKLAA